MDKRIEKVFDITQGDRVNIDLAERVGVEHLAVSYPQVNGAVEHQMNLSLSKHLIIFTARNYDTNQPHHHIIECLKLHKCLTHDDLNKKC